MSQREYDERTWEKVCELHRDVDQLRQTVAAYIAKQTEMCTHKNAALAVVQTEIFGNGKRGLRGDVAWIMDREKARVERTRLLVGVMCANIATIVGGAVWIVRLIAGHGG